MKRHLTAMILVWVLCIIFVCSISAQVINEGDPEYQEYLEQAKKWEAKNKAPARDDNTMYQEFVGKWEAVCNNKNIGTFHFVNDGRLIIKRNNQKLLFQYIPARYDNQEYIKETGIIGTLAISRNGRITEQWDVLSTSKNSINLRTNVLDEVMLSIINK